MRRLKRLVTATAAIAAAVAVVAGSEAKGYGSPPASAAPKPRVFAPMGRVAPRPEGAPDQPEAVPEAAFDGIADRTRQATEGAANAGADVSIVLLDRGNGRIISNGNSTTMAIASVAKLFIADDLLLQEAKGQAQLTAADRAALDTMLRSSDDDAAEDFWNRDGGSDIITRVATRYGLQSTAPPSDGRWWNTISSASDLVRYYDMLLGGSGGLAPERAEIILSNLAQSTASGVDGYPQRFGIPDGLFAEPVAVKQGWMCCIGADWMHLSTGVIGADRRYVMVIGSMQDSDDATARNTVTQAVATMFPHGRI